MFFLEYNNIVKDAVGRRSDIVKKVDRYEKNFVRNLLYQTRRPFNM